MYMITIDDKLSQHHKNGEDGVVDGQNCRCPPCYSSQFHGFVLDYHCLLRGSFLILSSEQHDHNQFVAA